MMQEAVFMLAPKVWGDQWITNLSRAVGRVSHGRTHFVDELYATELRELWVGMKARLDEAKANAEWDSIPDVRITDFADNAKQMRLPLAV